MKDSRNKFKMKHGHIHRKIGVWQWGFRKNILFDEWGALPAEEYLKGYHNLIFWFLKLTNNEVNPFVVAKKDYKGIYYCLDTRSSWFKKINGFFHIIKV